jgi:hypothetical protein
MRTALTQILLLSIVSPTAAASVPNFNHLQQKVAAARTPIAHAELLAEEPLYAPGWVALGKSLGDGNPRGAVIAIEKALALYARCDVENPLCGTDEKNWNETRELAADTNLEIANYVRAAGHYVTSDGRGDARWRAAAIFAAQGLESAWKDFKKYAPNRQWLAPLDEATAPGSGYKIKTEAQLRKSRKAPRAFAILIKNTFRKLQRRARAKGRKWDAFSHLQQASLAEAHQDRLFKDWYGRPDFYIFDETFNELNNAYLDLVAVNGRGKIVYRPHGSALFYEHREKARKAGGRGKFREAGKHYRLALALAPWWSDGHLDMAELFFINYGVCGVLGWYDKAEKAIRIEAVGARRSFDAQRQAIRSWPRRHKAIDDAIRKSGARLSKIKGYCNMPQKRGNPSTIAPDVEVLP